MKASCIIAALLLVVVSTANASDVPVLIWGKPSVTYVPALSKYRTSEFSALIESQTDDKTFTLVFAEDRLSIEDLSQCKLKTQTCFRNLAKIERKSYLPTVEEPLEALQRESGEIKSVQLSEDGTLSERITPEAGNIVIVNLRGDDFASHDALIHNLYNRLHSEFSNILVIYTGKTPSFRYSNLIRRTRQVKQEATEPAPKVLRVDKTFLMAYENFTVGNVGEALTEVSLDSPTKNTANSSDTALQIDIQGTSAKLSLHFELGQGSWEITGVTYDNAQYYLRHRVHINQHFSYRCNNLEYYTLDMKKQIVFTEVQIQPNWDSLQAEFAAFGDSWNCVGFTTPGILTGLFLVIIFLFIGGYGVTWMMDIRTMDRFDDPKGKTIIVNTAE